MTKHQCLFARLCAVVTLVLPAISGGAPLTLEEAESLALVTDTGYTSLIKQSVAFEDKAVADAQLPDPVLMFGWLNVPVEDFELDQEPMNQLRFSVKQMFPAGDTLEVKKNLTLADAARVREQAVMRRLWVLQQTRNAWFEISYWEAALNVVKENEPLFEQLRDVTTSFYSTGRKGLDDVVRSELELQRLKDRQEKISENIRKKRASLSRWIGDDDSQRALPERLPEWRVSLPEKQVLREQIISHPMVLAMDRQIDKLKQGVDLARQQYKPDWAIEFAYAFRDAHRPNGVEVSDVASIAASVTLPVFTANRQDKRVAAASGQFNAGLDRRLDMIKGLNARLDAELATLEKLNNRISLYENMILPQSRQQAQAALMAYKAEQSDFSEVMRSHIAQLESVLQLQRLSTDRLKAIASIRYLLPVDGDLARARENFEGETNEQ